ncbi:hypothetical protein J6590_034532 [Homalodisca vitripennis]|nr:hypothetical protein J6590_034532 [Homalodisca vitripennis]
MRSRARHPSSIFPYQAEGIHVGRGKTVSWAGGVCAAPRWNTCAGRAIDVRHCHGLHDCSAVPRSLQLSILGCWMIQVFGKPFANDVHGPDNVESTEQQQLCNSVDIHLTHSINIEKASIGPYSAFVGPEMIFDRAPSYPATAQSIDTIPSNRCVGRPGPGTQESQGPGKIVQKTCLSPGIYALLD